MWRVSLERVSIQNVRPGTLVRTTVSDSYFLMMLSHPQYLRSTPGQFHHPAFPAVPALRPNLDFSAQILQNLRRISHCTDRTGPSTKIRTLRIDQIQCNKKEVHQ
jgi:hypothetical protein